MQPTPQPSWFNEALDIRPHMDKVQLVDLWVGQRALLGVLDDCTIHDPYVDTLGGPWSTVGRGSQGTARTKGRNLSTVQGTTVLHLGVFPLAPLKH